MKEPKSEFGRELRKLRLEGKIRYSQSQLAKLADVTASYISQLETQERIPKPRVIRRLSIHLGVTPNHLFSKCGMVEMDLASTLANNRDEVRRKMPDLPEEQLEELASYLTYLEFKASAL
ncbi:MAG: helix-turn-helix domain-containing protein [Dehalococcoidia bacterium]|nr:helix-turn-helix domain-containing protein [Dehalococcoidia bacterium]